MGNFWGQPATDQNDGLQPPTATDERVQNNRRSENPALVPEGDDQPSSLTEEERVQHPPLMPGAGDQPPAVRRVQNDGEHTNHPLIPEGDRSSAEERVLQRHYDDLRRVIVHPLSVATQLVQEGVASSDLVEAVNGQGTTTSQKNVAILDAVWASIHSDPERFEVVMGVLENSTEAAPLVRKMKEQLSRVGIHSSERLTHRRDWWYTVPDYYKKDYTNLRASFYEMFYCVCEEVNKSPKVSVDTLKQYLCRYVELKDILQDADTVDQVMEAVRSECSLTDCSYLEEIASQFKLNKVAKRIVDYHEILDKFCQHTIADHFYVKSFREDYIHSSNKVTFRLQWNAQKKTLKDIRNVLYKAFRYLSVRVEIVVIQDGSVVMVCWAPQHLMKELVRLAELKRYKLREMGVVKLTIGDTELELPDQQALERQQALEWQQALEQQQPLERQQALERLRALYWQHQSGSLESLKLPALKQPVPTNKLESLELSESLSESLSELSEPQQKHPTLMQSLPIPSISDDPIDEFEDIPSVSPLPASIHQCNIPSISVLPRAPPKKLSYKYPSTSSAVAGTPSTTTRATRSKSAINPWPPSTTSAQSPSAINPPLMASKITQSQHSSSSQLIQVSTREGEVGQQIITGLKGPRGLVLTQEGNLIVAETWSHCITIINITSGEKIISIGQSGSEAGQFLCPRGVALTQNGNIVVADTGNDRLQVLTVEGAFVSAVGSKGSQPLQFNNPRDVAVHRNGKIFVTDQYNYRVQVLNPDLTYSHSFGKKGDHPGEFNTLQGVTIDSVGNIYVAEAFSNHRVQNFTPEGDVLAVIDHKEGTYSPRGLCVDSNNILYVTICINNSVEMFSTGGQHLGHIDVFYPEFIVSDQFGRLYISGLHGVIICKPYRHFF